jgi:hypothetical protein
MQKIYKNNRLPGYQKIIRDIKREWENRRGFRYELYERLCPLINGIYQWGALIPV